jgi:hypothetical protein
MPSEELLIPTPLETSHVSGSKPPPLAALFLIKFDLKVGYTIAWKRTIPEGKFPTHQYI